MGNTQDQDKGIVNKQNQHQPTLLEQAQLTDAEIFNATTFLVIHGNERPIANAATRKFGEVLEQWLREQAIGANLVAIQALTDAADELHAQLQQEGEK